MDSDQKEQEMNTFLALLNEAGVVKTDAFWMCSNLNFSRKKLHEKYQRSQAVHHRKDKVLLIVHLLS